MAGFSPVLRPVELDLQEVHRVANRAEGRDGLEAFQIMQRQDESTVTTRRMARDRTLVASGLLGHPRTE